VASGLAITRLALWEAPFIIGESRPRPPANTAKIYSDLVAAGRRGDAVEYFMVEVVRLPPEFAVQARKAPWWPAQEALAHTLAYDATIMGDYSLPTERAASVTVPTLVIDGGASFEWIGNTAEALARTIPNAKRLTLEGQTHDVSPQVLAPVLAEFFKG
jgi:pimeloyl-ACP methyl ester carboxylesterase